MSATVSPIAQTIADQIGRKAFFMMGTDQKFADGDALIFNLRGSPKANKIKVTLNGLDLYDIEFYKIGRAPAFKVTSKVVYSVFAEEMKTVIESETGLYLSL